MCQIRVKYITNYSIPSNPNKDRAGVYHSGYPVSVVEDDHIWGNKESMATFIAAGYGTAQDYLADSVPYPHFILKLPGIPAATILELAAVQTVDDSGVPVVDDFGNPVVYRKREWYLDYDRLHVTVMNELLSTGEFTIISNQDKQRVRQALRRIRDDLEYGGF